MRFRDITLSKCPRINNKLLSARNGSRFCSSIRVSAINTRFPSDVKFRACISNTMEGGYSSWPELIRSRGDKEWEGIVGLRHRAEEEELRIMKRKKKKKGYVQENEKHIHELDLYDNADIHTHHHQQPGAGPKSYTTQTD